MDKQSPFLEYMRFGEVKRLVHRFNDELTKKKTGSVAVLSLESGEGRTLLTAVLAIGSAIFMKKKVLVIDTSSQPEKGQLYLERILGEPSLGKCVDLITPKTPPGGGDGTADFELKELISHYREEYDLVLFDTSAINASGKDTMDPIIVSKTAGTAVMILSSESVASGNFQKIRDQMRDWEIPILGTVYNFMGAK